MSEAAKIELALAAASLLVYVAATTELAILWQGPRRIPSIARRFFAVAVRERKRGLERLLGTLVGCSVALGSQALTVGIALARTEPLDVVGRLVPYLELALATVWTVVLLGSHSRSRIQENDHVGRRS